MENVARKPHDSWHYGAYRPLCCIQAETQRLINSIRQCQHVLYCRLQPSRKAYRVHYVNKLFWWSQAAATGISHQAQGEIKLPWGPLKTPLPPVHEALPWGKVLPGHPENQDQGLRAGLQGLPCPSANPLVHEGRQMGEGLGVKWHKWSVQFGAWRKKTYNIWLIYIFIIPELEQCSVLDRDCQMTD